MSLTTTLTTTVKNHFMPKFRVRSALLMPICTLFAISAAQAQSTAAAAYKLDGPSSPMLQSVVAAPIPPSRGSRDDLDAAFNRADANRDGKLSRQEIEHFPALAAHFDQMDTDGDQFLSRDEFNKAAGN